MPCTFCAGTGKSSAESIENREAGRRMRQDRLRRGLSLRHEATRLGITAGELGEVERGLKKIDDILNKEPT
jgi:hypothetical protein